MALRPLSPLRSTSQGSVKAATTFFRQAAIPKQHLLWVGHTIDG